MAQSFDAIVLGAGAMGSAAAYYLTKAGQRVLVLEQFELDHDKGSSYGPSRIIRYVYDHPTYIKLAKATYPAWRALEEDAGETLYVRTGGLDFGFPDDPMLQNTFESLKLMNIPHEILTVQETQKRYPQFRLDADMTVIYQPDSGILPASKCVMAHLRLAEARGATVLANTPVTRLVVHDDSVEVQTDSETYIAGKLVITAGSWAKTVLGELGMKIPLTPLRCQVAFFNPSNPADFEPECFPTFIAHLEHIYGRMPYGMASYLDSGVKISFHKGDPVNHPSEVDYTPGSAEIERIRTFTSKYLPDTNAPLASSKICLYTMTPDEHFIIDKHPEYPHVVFGAGFSGHGFKFSTMIGSILSDLVLTGTTAQDIELFNAARFQ